MPSPSSTRIATPDLSPEHTDISLPPSPTPEDRERSRSILGKRASQDRDDSSRSSEDRARQKGGDLEDRSGMETPMEVDKASDDFELVPKPDREKAESPSAATEIAGLELKSPIEEKDPDWTTTEEPAISEDHSRPSPKKPPPLPPRPPLPARKDTLASGLRFGTSCRIPIRLVLTSLRLTTRFGGSSNQCPHPARACL
jgi:ubiquitin carboxyl-terminal hydrolase 25/28